MMKESHIVLTPAGVDCTTFDTGNAIPQIVKAILVPIRVKADMNFDDHAFTISYACNLQEKCHNYDCIYARFKKLKEERKEAEMNEYTSPITQF